LSGPARRNLLFLTVGLAAAGLLGAFGWQGFASPPSNTWTYSHLIDQVERGEVKQLQIEGTTGHVVGGDGSQHDVQLPSDTARLATTLAADGVDVSYGNADASALLQRLLPFLIIVPL